MSNLPPSQYVVTMASLSGFSDLEAIIQERMSDFVLFAFLPGDEHGVAGVVFGQGHAQFGRALMADLDSPALRM